MNKKIVGYRLRWDASEMTLIPEPAWYQGPVSTFRRSEAKIFATKEGARATLAMLNYAWQKNAKIVRVVRRSKSQPTNPDSLEVARLKEELRQERERADRFRDEAFALQPDADAWRKGNEVLRELQAQVIPCGHKVEDLIGGEGSVTKCGACLTALSKAKSANDPDRPHAEEKVCVPCEPCKGTGDSLYEPNAYCSVCQGERFVEVGG